jgi:hypothetical protein
MIHDRQQTSSFLAVGMAQAGEICTIVDNVHSRQMQDVEVRAFLLWLRGPTSVRSFTWALSTKVETLLELVSHASGFHCL